jgi:hypothetical protein
LNKKELLQMNFLKNLIRFLLVHAVVFTLITNAIAREAEIANRSFYSDDVLKSIVDMINSKARSAKEISNIYKKFDSKRAEELELFFKNNPKFQNREKVNATLENGKISFISEGKKVYFSLINNKEILLQLEDKSVVLNYMMPFSEIAKKIGTLFSTDTKNFSLLNLFISDAVAEEIFFSDILFVALEFTAFLTFPEVPVAALLTAGIGFLIKGLTHSDVAQADEINERIKECRTNTLFDDLTPTSMTASVFSNDPQFCKNNQDNAFCKRIKELKECLPSSASFLCQRLNEVKKCLQDKSHLAGKVVIFDGNRGSKPLYMPKAKTEESSSAVIEK